MKYIVDFRMHVRINQILFYDFYFIIIFKDNKLASLLFVPIDYIILCKQGNIDFIIGTIVVY